MLGLGSALTTGSTPEQMYSLTLDGTGDYLSIGNVLDLGTADFSISAWVKTADWHSFWIITKYQTANDRWYFRGSNDDPPRLHMYKVVDSSALTQYLGTSISLDDHQNTWTHVAISEDRNGKVVGYVNGVADTVDINGSAGDIDNTGDLVIGKYISSHADGLIDEVAIFNVALDADAVAAIYNSGKPFDLNYNRGNYDNASALQGYWKMNDGSGTTVVDSSTNSNNGTLAADAAFSTDTPDD